MSMLRRFCVSAAGYLSRRELFGAGLLAALVPQARAAKTKSLYEGSVYERLLGVRPLLSCRGHTTIYGGSLMPPEVLRAMAEANDCFVDMYELNEAAGRRISEVMKTEA